MREADLMYSRRQFLLTSVKAAAGVGAGLILGPAVFDYLDQLGPRRLLVNGVSWVHPEIAFNIELSRIYRDAVFSLRENATIVRLTTPIPVTASKGLLNRHQYPERRWPLGNDMAMWYDEQGRQRFKAKP